MTTLASPLLGLLAIAACDSGTCAIGAAWSQQSEGAPKQVLRALWADGPDDLYAVGYIVIPGSDEVHSPYIFHSIDQGHTWSQQQSESLFDIFGSGADIYAVGGRGTIVRSSDKGQSWSVLDTGFYPSPLPDEDCPHPCPYEPLEYRAGWASGDVVVAGTEGGTIVATSDGGQSWRSDSLPHPVSKIWGSGGDVYAAGGNSIGFSITRLGGATWSAESLGLQTNWLTGWGNNESEVYAVGSNGVLVMTLDRGATWSVKNNGFTGRGLLQFGEAFYGAWGHGSNIYLVGDSGTIIHSSDDGQNWCPEESGFAGRLLSVSGSSSGDAYVHGITGDATDNRNRAGFILHNRFAP